MKKLLVMVMAGIMMMLMLVTACNNRPVDNNGNNEIEDIMVEIGITAAEKNQVFWIRQSFVTNDRLKSLTMALESVEYRKAHGDITTGVVVEEDADWPGWYRASFSSTITIAE